MAFEFVTIYHGLCNTFHSMEHKPQFLYGLRDRLQKLGYRVGIDPVPYINYCLITISDLEVFRCNLKHLRFNTHYARDQVTQRAIAAILQASADIKAARTQLWIRSLMYHEMFLRRPHAPKDYWPEEVEIKPYVSCSKCVACCDILVTKIKDEELVVPK